MDKRHVLVGHLSPCRSLCEIHLFYALNGSGCNPLFKHPCLFFNRAYSPAAAAQTLATCNLPRPFLWPALVFKGTLPLLSTRFFLFCGFKTVLCTVPPIWVEAPGATNENLFANSFATLKRLVGMVGCGSGWPSLAMGANLWLQMIPSRTLWQSFSFLKNLNICSFHNWWSGESSSVTDWKWLFLHLNLFSLERRRIGWVSCNIPSNSFKLHIVSVIWDVTNGLFVIISPASHVYPSYLPVFMI